MIRPVSRDDAKEISDIYNYYILNSIATFEEKPTAVDEMRESIERLTSKFPWIAYKKSGKILGYAYASEWNSRHAYRHSGESTVYLKHGQSKKGIGTKLYQEIIKQLMKKKKR